MRRCGRKRDASVWRWWGLPAAVQRWPWEWWRGRGLKSNEELRLFLGKRTQRTWRNWPAVHRLSALPELTPTGRRWELLLLIMKASLFPSAAQFSVWNNIYHRSCSGSYTPPCCCTGCRCHDNLHRWMTGRCQCLGRRRTWGRQRGRGQRLASSYSVLQTSTLQLNCFHYKLGLHWLDFVYLPSHQQH